MSSAREIRRRIRASKNVAQITRAMEMVSASKMRRAQRNVVATRPYAAHILDIIVHLSSRATGVAVNKSLLEVRDPIERVAAIVITPDRGLCGSLISNILRRTGNFILEESGVGRSVDFFAIGRKGRDYLQRYGLPVIAEVTHLRDNPLLADVLGITTNVVQGFLNREYDEVALIYTQFVNTLVQRPVVQRVLPVRIEEGSISTREGVDYTYEPDQDEVLQELLPRFFETQVYQSVLEGIASEHSARMVAMRNATNNAKDLQRELTLSYNKARQAGITREVSEIAAGAAAQDEA